MPEAQEQQGKPKGSPRGTIDTIGDLPRVYSGTPNLVDTDYGPTQQERLAAYNARRLAIIDWLENQPTNRVHLKSRDADLARAITNNPDLDVAVLRNQFGFKNREMFTRSSGRITRLLDHYETPYQSLEKFARLNPSASSLEEYLRSQIHNYILQRMLNPDQESKYIKVADLPQAALASERDSNFGRFSTLVRCLDSMSGLSLQDRIAYLVTMKWDDERRYTDANAHTTQSPLSDTEVTAQIADMFSFEPELVDQLRNHVAQNHQERFARFGRWIETILSHSDKIMAIRQRRSNIRYPEDTYTEFVQWVLDRLDLNENDRMGWYAFYSSLPDYLRRPEESTKAFSQRFQTAANKLNKLGLLDEKKLNRSGSIFKQQKMEIILDRILNTQLPPPSLKEIQALTGYEGVSQIFEAINLLKEQGKIPDTYSMMSRPSAQNEEIIPSIREVISELAGQSIPALDSLPRLIAEKLESEGTFVTWNVIDGIFRRWGQERFGDLIEKTGKGWKIKAPNSQS